jgi:hypothetical protein
MHIERSQFAAGDYKVASLNGHGLRVPPVDAVEAEQIGKSLDVGKVVDGDQVA